MLCKTPDELRECTLVWKLTKSLGRIVKSALNDEDMVTKGDDNGNVYVCVVIIVMVRMM